MIATLKSLVTRQEDDEITVIYGSGSYRISMPFKKIEIDSVKWHGMDPRKRMKSVEQFRNYCPKMEGNFQKPAGRGRKPHERKRVRRPQAEIILDQMEKLEKVNVSRPKHSSEGRLRTAEATIITWL